MNTFKKNTLLKLVIISSVILIPFLSCKKEKINEADAVSDGPICSPFFGNNNYFIDSSNSSGNNYESGCLFSVTKNGKIVKLGAKMPTAGSYRVTLWDAASKTQLAQANVVQTKNAVSAFSVINPVAISAGKTYLVSIWMAASGKYFSVFNAGGGNIVYPIVSGDISITGYVFTITPQNPITYPTTGNLVGISGIADIEFQAD